MGASIKTMENSEEIYKKNVILYRIKSNIPGTNPGEEFAMCNYHRAIFPNFLPCECYLEILDDDYSKNYVCHVCLEEEKNMKKYVESDAATLIKKKQEILERIYTYIKAEDFPLKHREAILSIVQYFNYSDESQENVFNFVKMIKRKIIYKL